VPTQRLFLAANVSDEQRQALGQLIENLAKGIRFTRAHPAWVKPENIHLTLKFLGDVEETRIESIAKALGTAITHVQPIPFDIAKLGVFPDAQAPRVLWIGIDQGRSRIADLAGTIENAMARIGFPRERRAFHPHLTLARIKAVRGVGEMMDVVESHRRAHLPAARIHAVTLYRSTLRPEGAVYSVVREWPLRGETAGEARA